MNKRNATIDVAKGLGILLVVLGHNALLDRERGEPFRVVFSFHMPLFFFLLFILLFHWPLQNKVYHVLAPFSGSHVLAGAVSLIVGIGGPVVVLEVVKRFPFLAYLLLPLPSKAVPRSEASPNLPASS